MSHITVAGVTEQHYYTSYTLHATTFHTCNIGPTGNNSDQNPSHIGHCESSTMSMLTFLAITSCYQS